MKSHFIHSFSVYFPALLCSTLFICGCNTGDQPAELTADQLLGTSSTDAVTPKAKNAPDAYANHLELKLKPGDRFPLLKTVEKEITQSSLNGLTKGTERLDLMMAVSVEDIQNDLLKMRVTYTKVKYFRELNGKTVEFDSSTQGFVAPEARPYHGMVNNNFSFWLGSDNQIVELIDFPTFLERCLQDIPNYEREQAVSLLAASAGKDGVANFIDDSIGLLPYNQKGETDKTMVSVGSTWTRERNINSEMPITINQTYTVKELNTKTAKVDIMGTISPMSTVGDSKQLAQDVELEVRSGNSFGHCIIDVNTGLPIESHLDQFIDMQVKLSGGITFDQRKRIVTNIKAFPQQLDSADIVGQEQNSPIKQVSGQSW